jgi:hypothetical protein
MPNKAITEEGAAAFLQSTQRLRCHWSHIIILFNGYAITLNTVVWSYLMRAYVDRADPTYPMLAAAVSGITLGLWRVYAHYLDNNIAGLYADLMLCEDVLGFPGEHGTTAYLARRPGPLKGLLENADLSAEQKRRAVKELHHRRRLGYRGHKAFDLIVLCILILFAALLSANLWGLIPGRAPCWARAASTIGVLAGFVSTLWAKLSFQRDPSRKDVKDVTQTAIAALGK